MKSVVQRCIVLFACLLLSFGPAFAQKGKKEKKKDESPLNAKTFSGLKLRGIGPALMSGRIADIAIHPGDQSTWYVGVGSGGVWKTTNSGTTWTPIFDDQGAYSIGCVAIDPNRPEVIWVGTGENVGGRHVSFGDGVYRSMDGGSSWENVGLKDSQHIGNILIDPRDSNVVYVASQGPLWSPGGDRGLFKTVDGGGSWEKILGGGEYTGVNEVHMDPRNPDVLFASTHQRYRSVAALMDGGPESGIHKSMDGGKTWQALKNGLPKVDMGKIGLTISPLNPDVVYATIEAAQGKGGFFRSENSGGSWEKRNDYLSGGTGPHYYQEIFASPHKFDRVYQMDARFRVTEDGGKTFAPVGETYKHGDNHAMAFDPNDPEYMIVGSDGGIYETWDLGKNWKYIANLPITQFYKVAVDYDEPFYNIYGGTQDNNTQGGPSQTGNTAGIRNSDWFITVFADGHQPAVDYSNPDIIYSEWQEGNLVRYDRKNGEIVFIQPQPEPGEPAERFNWDAPILISPHDPARLYYASQRVWRSDSRGDAWKPVSGDLTRGEDRLTKPMMGQVWSIDSNWDLGAMSNFGTITSLAESPLVEGLLYAGTDDGLIQVSDDGGANWRKIEVGSLPGVPKVSFINDIKADLHDADTVYVALDNHKSGDFKPYLVKSTDRGKSWTSIAGDLPDRHLVWRVVQDHVAPKLLFVGTEFGIFFTVDGGAKWVKLTGGVPNISFRDLAIQKRENDLVGASFGRSFYVFDDYTPLRSISEESLNQEAALFPVKDAWWYIPRRPLGRGEKATQGGAFFTAPNPEFGAIFTYYLKDGYKSRKEIRRERERDLVKDGKGAPYPGWDALHEEEMEEEPAIYFTVSDADGNVIRHIKAPAKAGFHRVAWDFRYPSLNAWRPGSDDNDFFPSRGALAAPGAYTVSMAKWVDGVLTPLGEPRTFNVKPLIERALPGSSIEDMVAFLKKFDKLQRAFSGAVAVARETETRLGAMKSVLVRSTVGDPGLYAGIVALEKELYGLTQKLRGDQIKGGIGEPTPHSISDRLSVIQIGNMFSTYGPTPTHLRGYEIAIQELGPVRDALNAMSQKTIPELEQKLEAAGVAWTPGRAIPKLP